MNNSPNLTPTACAQVCEAWIEEFGRAIHAGGARDIQSLFMADGHLRNLLVLGWQICTYTGATEASQQLAGAATAFKPRQLAVNHHLFEPHHVKRAGEWTVECALTGVNDTGPFEGVLRLRQEPDGVWRAWTLVLALCAIEGSEELHLRASPQAQNGRRSFSGPNWKDRRDQGDRFGDRQPDVIIVGAGQAGLAVGARLKQLGVDALIVDQNARVGDNWRKRYHALVLHNQRHVNHLPYIPFPETWPSYIPKDKLAGWFEYYAEAMELAVWTSTRFVGGEYDETEKIWRVTLETTAGTRELTPRHIILATGVSAIPKREPLPELAPYQGTAIHSADYVAADVDRFPSAIVIGTGTSAHDVAQDLAENGVKVTMVQRSPTMVQNVEPTAQLPYVIYGGSLSTDACDLITVGTPMALYKTSSRLSLGVAEELDRDLIAGLRGAGFRVNTGTDGVSWQLMYITKGGGYYFNVGCSDLIIEGKIRVVQHANIQRFVANGFELASGELVTADLVVTANGYLGQSEMVGKLLGDAVRTRVGAVWGIDSDTQELNNMWMETPQEGLWFCAGSLAQCRIYSKYLALQIKAKLNAVSATPEV